MRRVVGLAADEVELTLPEAKDLVSELPQRLMLQTQIEEYTMCGRVFPGS